jgi:hypothetical protein
MTLIQRIFADFSGSIRENPLYQRHPRSVNSGFGQQYPNTTKSG